MNLGISTETFFFKQLNPNFPDFIKKFKKQKKQNFSLSLFFGRVKDHKLQKKIKTIDYWWQKTHQLTMVIVTETGRLLADCNMPNKMKRVLFACDVSATGSKIG